MLQDEAQAANGKGGKREAASTASVAAKARIHPHSKRTEFSSGHGVGPRDHPKIARTGIGYSQGSQGSQGMCRGR